MSQRTVPGSPEGKIPHRPHVMYTVPVGQNPSGAVSLFLLRCCPNS